MPASALTAKAMARFGEQPDHHLQPLDDRVMAYRKSGPILGGRTEGTTQHHHHNPMADRLKDWSDRWERLERQQKPTT
jgi:hypothetical protein